MTTQGVGRVPTALAEFAEQQLTGTGLDLAAALTLLTASEHPYGPANSVTAALTEGWHSADPDPSTTTTGAPADQDRRV